MAKKNIDHVLLTSVDISRKLGYTIQHTRLLIRQGKLRAIKVGRDWLIKEEDYREFIRVRSPEVVALT